MVQPIAVARRDLKLMVLLVVLVAVVLAGLVVLVRVVLEPVVRAIRVELLFQGQLSVKVVVEVVLLLSVATHQVCKVVRVVLA